ncbi:MAG: thiol-disulfide oxidoreductase DCC family protein, partial [Vicinamibacterales bacterium]
FIDLTLGMVMIHLFTFDPAWIKSRPPRAAGTERIFYDGVCGLCHRWARFVLAEDRTGETFRLAALQSETFEKHVPPEDRENLPDSIIVQTADGRLLVKSTAVLYILARLGGAWRTIAVIGQVIPRVVRDAAYDFVASIRYRLFAKPTDVCPLVPADLRKRFDA